MAPLLQRMTTSCCTASCTQARRLETQTRVEFEIIQTSSTSPAPHRFNTLISSISSFSLATTKLSRGQPPTFHLASLQPQASSTLTTLPLSRCQLATFTRSTTKPQTCKSLQHISTRNLIPQRPPVAPLIRQNAVFQPGGGEAEDVVAQQPNDLPF